jgi:Ca2+-binding RTX toxin-like protein
MHRGNRNASLSFGRFESLESRRLFAVTASLAGGVLDVLGDAGANAITVSRDVAGNITVKSGANVVAVTGGAPTVATVQTIKVTGSGGSDAITLDETNGPLPAASLSGGGGNDAITGGAGDDTINGDDGNDLLLGKGGADTLHGGAGNDTLVGGTGTDDAFGDGGDDRMTWNPGDGSDLNEGGDGVDTIDVNGGAAGETFRAQLLDGRVFFDRTNATPNPFAIDIGTSEKLVLNAGDGNDTFEGGTGLAGVMTFTVSGGGGDDKLFGTDGADRLIGDDGNDAIDGNGGADLALMGNGNDVFIWDPGDGSDIVEGQGGLDRMIFNGAKGDEHIDLSARGNRLRFFRDAGNITMDTNDVETVDFNALGGADEVTVHNLRGTDVRSVNVDLSPPPKSTLGDGVSQTVVVDGSDRGDIIAVTSSQRGVNVTGVGVLVSVTGNESIDRLTVRSLGGDDIVNAVTLDADSILFRAEGGDGRDVLIGGAGNDTLLGGNSSDLLIGAAGDDVLDGGPGLDIVLQ